MLARTNPWTFTSSIGMPLKNNKINVMNKGPATTAHRPPLKIGVTAMNIPHHKRIWRDATHQISKIINPFKRKYSASFVLRMNYIFPLNTAAFKVHSLLLWRWSWKNQCHIIHRRLLKPSKFQSLPLYVWVHRNHSLCICPQQ